MSGFTGAGWTEERIAALPGLCAAGLSAAQIAAQLGGGLSRNAVIGKVHRRGLSLAGGNGRPVSSNPRPRTPRAARPYTPAIRAPASASRTIRAAPAARPRRIAPRPLSDIPVPASREVSILDLDGATCRYPDGGFRDSAVTYCGHRVFGGTVYCEYHSRLCYTPPDRRRGRLEHLARGLR